MVLLTEEILCKLCPTLQKSLADEIITNLDKFEILSSFDKMILYRMIEKKQGELLEDSDFFSQVELIDRGIPLKGKAYEGKTDDELRADLGNYSTSLSRDIESLKIIKHFSNRKKKPSIVRAEISSECGCIDSQNEEVSHVHWWRFLDDSKQICDMFEYELIYPQAVPKD